MIMNIPHVTFQIKNGTAKVRESNTHSTVIDYLEFGSCS